MPRGDVPPIAKPQTKKKEAEGKKAKKTVAVAALLLLLLLGAVVEAQTNGTQPVQNVIQPVQNGTQPGNQPGGAGGADPEKALEGFKNIGKAVVLGVRVAIALAFWAALAIMIVHFALGKVAPARFQRLGAFWDGLERAKDIIYGYAWLFLLILAVYTTIGIVTGGGQIGPQTVGQVVNWIMVEPIVQLGNELGIR